MERMHVLGVFAGSDCGDIVCGRVSQFIHKDFVARRRK
jgi:hypothetical protein